MIVDSARIIVLAFGFLVGGLSVWGLYRPGWLITRVQGVLNQQWGLPLAIIVRVLLGWALLVGAPASRFPRTFEVLGWLAIVAAVALVFVGQERLQRLVSWFDRFPPMLLRLWLLFGAGFGGFLIYAA